MFRTRGSHRDRESFRRFIDQLEALPPRELESRLVARGYRGQAAARRSVCLMAYRHVKRILRIHRDQRSPDELPAKTNYLLIGPTGCGKTYITELLFNEVLKVPSVTVDITAYSETGYVGQDPCAILTRLLHVCGGNPLLAQVGVVCLDEFDKLSSGSNNAVFAGAGTTKDVTGRGVQRELLKMLEGSDVEVPTELTQSSYADRAVISTRHLTFVACGAFSGFKSIAQASGHLDPTIGFGRLKDGARGHSAEAIAVHLSQDEVERTAHFQAYGFMPELIGRFTRVIPFQPLDTDTMLRILNDNIVRRFELEFADEGLELVISDKVRMHIVSENLRKETGARGLASVLTRHIEEAAFEAFGDDDVKSIRLEIDNDEVVSVRE